MDACRSNSAAVQRAYRLHARTEGVPRLRTAARNYTTWTMSNVARNVNPDPGAIPAGYLYDFLNTFVLEGESSPPCDFGTNECPYALHCARVLAHFISIGMEVRDFMGKNDESPTLHADVFALMDDLLWEVLPQLEVGSPDPLTARSRRTRAARRRAAPPPPAPPIVNVPFSPPHVDPLAGYMAADAAPPLVPLNNMDYIDSSDDELSLGFDFNPPYFADDYVGAMGFQPMSPPYEPAPSSEGNNSDAPAMFELLFYGHSADSPIIISDDDSDDFLIVDDDGPDSLS